MGVQHMCRAFVRESVRVRVLEPREEPETDGFLEDGKRSESRVGWREGEKEGEREGVGGG